MDVMPYYLAPPFRALLDVNGGARVLFSQSLLWYFAKQLQVVIPVLIGLVTIILLLIVLFSKRKQGDSNLQEDLKKILDSIRENAKTEECEIEFPAGEVLTEAKFLKVWSESLGSHTHIQDIPLPGAFLKIDCITGGGIPLEFKDVDRIEEVIIARRRAPEDAYKKNDKAVYLWVPEKNKVVSRPTETRFGHARIFLTENDRYAVEDLGSASQTFLNGKDIRGSKDAILLEDRDYRLSARFRPLHAQKTYQQPGRIRGVQPATLGGGGSAQTKVTFAASSRTRLGEILGVLLGWGPLLMVFV